LPREAVELHRTRAARRRAHRAAASLLRDHLKPPPQLTVSEWADEHRIVPATSAEPGRWRTSRTPYLREVMDAFSDPLVERVVFMKGAQVGGSEALNNVIGYFIDQDPSTVLFVQTTDEEAANYSRERIAPMISDCAVLKSKVSAPRSRDSTNTVDAKSYPGGHLGIVGANAPSGLRSRPRRVVLFDDVDGYPASAGDEGDPIELAVKRTSTYWNRKVGLVSTPTTKGASRIENAFEESDQRFYYVPCPHCGQEQRLQWDRVRWDKLRTPDGPVSVPSSAHYVCEACDERIEERHKVGMLERGRWIATKPEREVVGFHLSALYSPWFTWVELVEEFLSAKDHVEKLRVFINTRLAETFEERGDAPEWKRLYERRESYELGTCPEGVVFLTAGVDVQNDRVEGFVWGWGYDKESWFVEHVVAEGRPAEAGTWDPITAMLHRTYPGAGGVSFPLAAVAVDTGFDHLSVVDWLRRVGDRRVMLVKGDHWKNWTVVVGSPTKSEVVRDGRRFGYLLWPVGGALIKQETYGFLGLEAPVEGERYPPGYVHLPMVGSELVQQLVAEDLVTSTDKYGRAKRAWVTHRRRNEGLDGRVYARAAAEREGLSRLVRPLEELAIARKPHAKQLREERSRGDDDSGRNKRPAGWLKRRGGKPRGGWL